MIFPPFFHMLQFRVLLEFHDAMNFCADVDFIFIDYIFPCSLEQEGVDSCNTDIKHISYHENIYHST